MLPLYAVDELQAAGSLAIDSGRFQKFFILENKYNFFQGIKFFHDDDVKSFLMKKCIKYTVQAAS